MCKRNDKSKENTLDDNLPIISAKMVVIVKLDICSSRPAAELQVVMASCYGSTYAAYESHSTSHVKNTEKKSLTKNNHSCEPVAVPVANNNQNSAQTTQLPGQAPECKCH